MKAPSVRDFSVFSHLGTLGPLQWTNIHIRSLEENFEKTREFHWKKPVYNVLLHWFQYFGQSFPMKIALVFDFSLYVA